jgi:tetratricopeptide (TPR) repeat protein
MWMNEFRGGFMRTSSGAPRIAALALGTLTLFSAAGCSKIAELQAQKAFKDANAAYQQQDYKKAAGLYDEAVQDNPELGTAYFFLGNSYDNLWKPSKKGDATNDALLTKAVDSYQKAAEKLSTSDKPEDKKIGKLALQYLVQAYNADRLNDPAKAEPVVQRMIQLDPSDTDNYFALAKIYEDVGVYDEAEKVLLMAKTAKPSEPAVYMQLAGYYDRQGNFDKKIQAAEERAQKESNNPEAFYTVATFYWDEAYRDPRLKESEKRTYVEKGVEAIDHALKIKPDYAEALVYKNLLLRLEANLEKDPAKQQALIKQADQLRDKAQEIRKAKAAGASN